MDKITISFLFSIFLLTTANTNAEQTQRSPESLVFTCYTCHGTDGKSSGNIPTLNGLTPEMIAQAMRSFQKDENGSTIMNRIAKGYSENEIVQIADYLGAIK